MLSDVENNMLNENEETTIDEENIQETEKAFLKLKEHGRFSRTRAMRLKPDDFILAVDGKIFAGCLRSKMDLEVVYGLISTRADS